MKMSNSRQLHAPSRQELARGPFYVRIKKISRKSQVNGSQIKNLWFFGPVTLKPETCDRFTAPSRQELAQNRSSPNACFQKNPKIPLIVLFQQLIHKKIKKALTHSSSKSPKKGRNEQAPQGLEGLSHWNSISFGILFFSQASQK